MKEVLVKIRSKLVDISNKSDHVSKNVTSAEIMKLVAYIDSVLEGDKP